MKSYIKQSLRIPKICMIEKEDNNLKKLAKRLSALLIISLLIGVVPVQTAEAATYTFKLTGKMSVSWLPFGKYVGDPDLTPTFKKDKDGVYTLTMYDGSEAGIGIKTTVDIRALPLKESKYIIVKTHHPDYLYISTSGIGGKKTLKETMTFQLKDTRETINGKKNTNYGKRVGPEVKINIVIKALPEEKWVGAKKQALEEINLSQYETDFDKVAAIYDWITYNITYDYSYSISSWEGALVYKTSVCSGFAGLFSMLADEAGIESIYVSGKARGSDGWGSHAWNLVKVDEKWYFLDATFDGVNLGYSYFLKSEEYFSTNHEFTWVVRPDISKKNYELPDSLFIKRAESDLEELRAVYNKEAELFAEGADVYLAYILKKDWDFDIKDLDEYFIEYYGKIYLGRMKDFCLWLGYPSEEAYIAAKATTYRLDKWFSGLSYTEEEKQKMVEEIKKKYFSNSK